MRILLVKTSSLGDVVHNLPVAADLARALPGTTIDWCVEEGFADIPRLSPHVRQVMPVAIRRWRKHLLSAATWREIGELRRTLREGCYDRVLDTQGLLKSALIATQSSGARLGYDAGSAREPIAARFYDACFPVSRALHAVERNRRLAAAAFGYTLPDALDYGIAAPPFAGDWIPEGDLALCLTATSRDDKRWPDERWIALGRELSKRGLTPIFPAGSAVERARAERIAAEVSGAVVAPALSIRELAGLIGRTRLVVGVDTGLVHLAAALRVPTIALYTATQPGLTGVVGTGFTRNLGGIGVTPTVDEVLQVADEAKC